MQLFYLENLNTDTFQFSEEESKHCIKVLRKKLGDPINLIDGKGTSAVAEIVSDNPKRCEGKILNRQFFPKNRNYQLHVGIAPTKSFDRMEWFIEKSIEIGIDEITFLETENSERSTINLERCEKIAISAIKQSKQYYLPTINPILSLSKFYQLHQNRAANKFIAWCEAPQTNNLFQAIQPHHSSNNILLIGPEGDFTSQEANQAMQSGFLPISMGSNILRTETAAIFGVSTLANKYGCE